MREPLSTGVEMSLRIVRNHEPGGKLLDSQRRFGDAKPPLNFPRIIVETIFSLW